MAATMRQAHRIAWLSFSLCMRGMVTYRKYAQRFEASEATYYRDLGLLRAIGVEVKSKRNHGRVRLGRVSL